MSPNSVAFLSKEKIASSSDIPAPSPLEGGKMSQVAAKYRDDAVKCGNCSHFLPPSECDVVEGPVSAEASSDKFERKGGTFEGMSDVNGDDVDD
jgi:hypothetical protein